MHAPTLVLLLLCGIVSSWAAHQREEKGEDCYRAALAADTDAGREFQLALFTVFKTQVASYRLRADLLPLPQPLLPSCLTTRSRPRCTRLWLACRKPAGIDLDEGGRGNHLTLYSILYKLRPVL
jgi:hypothetical protein